MNPGAALRANAARALARIVFDGMSLRVALDAANREIADPRDRALAAAMLFASTRWWLRLDAALARLLERAMPPSAREVRALIVLGFAQIDVLGVPDYAVVASSVDAARLLGKPRHGGLVNALLRRFVRERTLIAATLDADPVTRHAHPGWMIDAIRADWPQQAEAILEADNREAPLTLRANRRRTDRDALIARFGAEGIAARAHELAADAIVLDASADVTRLPGYAEGLFSVQDAAAQRVADLLDLADGQRVLDACAAPGGKSAHVLERADVDLVALDRDPARLERVDGTLARLGLAARVVAGDAADPASWFDGKRFDRILIDAPCSATGIVRRQPDIKLHRRAADIAPLATMQSRMLAALWTLLAPGGRLVYATCSLLRAENQGVLAPFLESRDDAIAVPVPPAFGEEAGTGRQNLPGAGGMDGFCYAIVDKAR